jgi:hypothetical protein
LPVRLKFEDSRERLMATISQPNNLGKITAAPSMFIAGTQEEAKDSAKALAPTVGLKTYGIVDKTRTAMHPAT